MNIQYNTAKLAKEKGFDIPVWSFYGYDKKLRRFNQICNFNGFKHGVNKASISSPTQSELQKWLREVHNLFVIIDYNGKFEYTKWFYTIKSDTNQKVFDGGYWDTYEECLEVALLESLKLI